jgi:hypothetical protein
MLRTGRPKGVLETRPRRPKPNPMLAGYRHVATKPKEKDKNEWHKTLRELLNNDPDRFMKEMQKQEDSYNEFYGKWL